MERQNLEFVNVAVVGSTHLTLRLLETLETIRRPRFVFGLPDALVARKANGVRLDSFCAAHDIALDTSNDWASFARRCAEAQITLVLEFGDSRRVPAAMTTQYQVVGNHGAMLPDVQGAASLVWGRLLNSGRWGVSLFALNAAIDAGDILATSSFEYDTSIRMRDFVDVADAATIRLFMDVASNGYVRRANSPWHTRVERGRDAYTAVTELRVALCAHANVYMPPRTPEESRLDAGWPEEFQRVFALANDDPYPKMICVCTHCEQRCSWLCDVCRQCNTCHFCKGDAG